MPDEKKPATPEMISCFAHEAEMNRMERMNQRLLYLIVAILFVALSLFTANNFLWMRHTELGKAAWERMITSNYETNPGVYEQSNQPSD